jgi:hypothetical protein
MATHVLKTRPSRVSFLKFPSRADYLPLYLSHTISGECSKNPGYMELACAGPCGQGWRWSPFVKQSLGLPPHVASRHNTSLHGGVAQPTGNPALDGALAVAGRLRFLFEQVGGGMLRQSTRCVWVGELLG